MNSVTLALLFAISGTVINKAATTTITAPKAVLRAFMA
jgi:hypothetical protein